MAAIWLTDNGSNMVAAFKDQITGKVGVESVDDDDDAEQCYINVDPGNSNESDILDEPIEYDSDHDSDVEINGEQAASTDIFNFEQENEHSLAFSSYKRIWVALSTHFNLLLKSLRQLLHLRLHYIRLIA